MSTNRESREPQPTVTCSHEPSDAAWERFGDIAARILESLAERDARAEADRRAGDQ